VHRFVHLLGGRDAGERQHLGPVVRVVEAAELDEAEAVRELGGEAVGLRLVE
jgi:hypothetical protein